MTSPLFWCCLAVAKNPTPAQRITEAVDAVEHCLGYVPAVVHCHPATAAETTAPFGIAEIVPDSRIKNPAEFRFVREDQPALNGRSTDAAHDRPRDRRSHRARG